MHLGVHWWTGDVWVSNKLLRICYFKIFYFPFSKIIALLKVRDHVICVLLTKAVENFSWIGVLGSNQSRPLKYTTLPWGLSWTKGSKEAGNRKKKNSLSCHILKSKTQVSLRRREDSPHHPDESAWANFSETTPIVHSSQHTFTFLQVTALRSPCHFTMYYLSLK